MRQKPKPTLFVVLLGAILLGAIVGLLVTTRASPPEAEREAKAVRGRTPDLALRDDVVDRIAEVTSQQEASSLDVRVRDGRVRLQGQLASEAERQEIERAARRVPGVLELDVSALEVQRTE